MALGKSVLIVMASRMLVLFAGLIVSIVAAHRLSSVEQGYFFTFLSLAAAQQLFELGITSLFLHYLSHARSEIVQATDHGKKRIALDIAESARKYTSQYYGRASVLFMIFIGIGGALFFASSGSPQVVYWQMPWALTVAGTALSLFNLSYYLYLEAFGHFDLSYRVRINSTVIVIFVFSAAAYTFGGLLSYPLALIAGNCYALIILRRACAAVNIEFGLMGKYIQRNINIGLEQRKMAVSAVAGYVTANSLTIYSFHFFGAETAGQIGLTMSIFAAIATLAMARTTAEAPSYGPMIASGELKALKRRYFHTLVFCISLALFFSLCTIAARQVGLALFPEYTNRVLDLFGFIVVSLLIVANVSLSVTSTVLRAFKTEQLMWPSIGAAALVLIAQMALKLHPVHCLGLLALFNALIFYPFAQIRLNSQLLARNV